MNSVALLRASASFTSGSNMQRLLSGALDSNGFFQRFGDETVHIRELFKSRALKFIGRTIGDQPTLGLVGACLFQTELKVGHNWLPGLCGSAIGLSVADKHLGPDGDRRAMRFNRESCEFSASGRSRIDARLARGQSHQSRRPRSGIGGRMAGTAARFLGETTAIHASGS